MDPAGSSWTLLKKITKNPGTHAPSLGGNAMQDGQGHLFKDGDEEQFVDLPIENGDVP